MEKDKGALPTWIMLTPVILLASIIKSGELFLPVLTDSGAYAYIGKHIIQGKLPYLDIWENKPPGIFYLDALIFWLAPHASMLYLRLFEIAFIAATTFVFFLLSRHFLSRVPAIFSTSVFAVFFNLRIFSEGGNLTEQYVAMFEIIAILLILKYFKGRNLLYLFIAGVISGVGFLFKQPGILIIVAACVALSTDTATKTTNSWPQKLNTLLKINGILIIGALVPVLLVSAYFFATRVFSDFISAAFTYNLGVSLPVDWQKFWLNVTPTWMLWVPALAGACVAVHKFYKYRNVEILLIVLWLLAGIISTGMGGSFFGHYFMFLIAQASLMGGIAFEHLAQSVRHTSLNKATQVSIVSSIVIFLLVASAESSPVERQMTFLKTTWQHISSGNWSLEPPGTYSINKIITDTTSANDYVFIYGVYPEIYFDTDRECPSRYIYIFPFTYSQAKDYDQAKRVDELIRSLKLHPAKLFIYVVDGRTALRGNQPAPELVAFINKRYRPLKKLESPYGLQVYIFKLKKG